MISTRQRFIQCYTVHSVAKDTCTRIKHDSKVHFVITTSNSPTYMYMYKQFNDIILVYYP